METEKLEFKVGDRVRIKKTKNEAKVVAVLPDNEIAINFDNDFITLRHIFRSDSIEPATYPEEKINGWKPFEFKVGDVVQLKSGGPHMTVTSVSEDNIAVTWFMDGGHSLVNFYPPECLLVPLTKPYVIVKK